MAIKHILVPLDGSHLAEAVLPAVAYLAKTLSARVTLLHMIEQDAPQEIHGDRHLVDVEEAQAYLEGVAARALLVDLVVTRHVHSPQIIDVARSIVAHTEEIGADLVVMCSHGRGGLRRWVLGSIAQQVLSLGKTPLLLISPREVSVAPAFNCQHILVPLDGNSEHEQGLVFAVDLAKDCRAALHLVMVVPQLYSLSGEQAGAAMFSPGTASAVLDLAEQGGESYLRDHIRRLQAETLSVSAEVQRGDPLKKILRAAQKTRADLIVMGTHGKTAMDSFWSDSLTPKLSSRAHMPLLLVPVSER